MPPGCSANAGIVSVVLDADLDTDVTAVDGDTDTGAGSCCCWPRALLMVPRADISSRGGLPELGGLQLAPSLLPM